jgi:altronate dehydratase small subunit
MNVRAFQIHLADNVATLLDDVDVACDVAVIGGVSVTARQPIASAHKIALARIPVGSPVVKFGVQIGLATRDIAPGDWVHLHNLASRHDERSSTLDINTGAPTDSASAYV